jgi:hypothetical protein
MAKKRAGRPRKAAKRSKSGRLSRAYKSIARDEGTEEFVEKRKRLINGADPSCAATASGILFANGVLSRDQHNVCLR